MGNNSSSSSSSSSSASVTPANSRSLLSESELQQIRKWVAREYPWIPTVNESMLITDVRKPDCPIVQANIEFEMMTGYPAAEILGRNCRFLQGPGSSAATVTRIRNAVKSGSELNVELLNYTKYGVPFVNAFAMYPIHRNGTPSGELRYFIAIQKDVTQIKSLPAQPADWNPQEVVVWLERMGLLDAARNLVNAAIDGAGLLALTDASLSENYDISDPEPILEAVRLLTTSPPPPAIASSSSGTSALYTPVTQSLTAAPQWWNVGEGSNQRFLVRVLRDGNHDESPFLVTATSTTELATVRAAIDKHHGKPCNLKLIDTKNSSSAGVPLTKALWNQMRSELAGQEMTLSAFPQKVKLSEREQAAFEASAAGMLVVSGDRVIFANSTLLATIRKSAEQVSGEHFGRIVSNFSLDDHTSGFRKCFVVHNDGAQIGMLGDMRRTRRGKLAVLTLVPLGVFGSNES